jgi:hypothetical protein
MLIVNVLDISKIGKKVLEKSEDRSPRRPTKEIQAAAAHCHCKSQRAY